MFAIDKKYSPIRWGMAGALAISLVFYLAQVLGMRNWRTPLYFMATKWYFILPLIIGFAVQAGLFRAIHLKVKRGGGGIMAASGGFSTTAMAACCSHNFITLLPLMGLSGAAVFLSTYQNYVFLFSILFVIGGVVYMIKKYQRIHIDCY